MECIHHNCCDLPTIYVFLNYFSVDLILLPIVLDWHLTKVFGLVGELLFRLYVGFCGGGGGGGGGVGGSSM